MSIDSPTAARAAVEELAGRLPRGFAHLAGSVRAAADLWDRGLAMGGEGGPAVAARARAWAEKDLELAATKIAEAEAPRVELPPAPPVATGRTRLDGPRWRRSIFWGAFSSFSHPYHAADLALIRRTVEAKGLDAAAFAAIDAAAQAALDGCDPKAPRAPRSVGEAIEAYRSAVVAAFYAATPTARKAG